MHRLCLGRSVHQVVVMVVDIVWDGVCVNKTIGLLLLQVCYAIHLMWHLTWAKL